MFPEFHVTLPLKDGSLRMDYEAGILNVLSDREGGTLVAGGRKYPLPAGETVTVSG